jgi:lipoprotein NlpD
MPLRQLDRGERMGKIKSSLLPAVLILLVLSLVVSCFKPQIQKSQTMGVYHLVKKNETVQMIARAYKVPLQNLVEANNITNVNQVKEGSIVFVPSANQIIDNIGEYVNANDNAAKVRTKDDSADNVKDLAKNKDIKEIKNTPVKPVVKFNIKALHIAQYTPVLQWPTAAGEKPAPVKTVRNKQLSDEKNEPEAKAPKPQEKIQTEKNKFIWPAQGSVKTQFGIQPNKTYHNWIKIVSTAGTKVKAAAAGTVIFSSNLKNYGETIIIRHKESYATVYTHLKKRYVRMDQNVKKGETVALLGEKDDDGNAYMNFEVRLKGNARNPLFFLP